MNIETDINLCGCGWRGTHAELKQIPDPKFTQFEVTNGHCPKCNRKAFRILTAEQAAKLPPYVPKPTGTEAAVCADIAKRQAHGLAKYGVTVAENPLTLREWLQHAYEETLDEAVYLRRSIDEIDAQQADKKRELLG